MSINVEKVLLSLDLPVRSNTALVIAVGDRIRNDGVGEAMKIISHLAGEPKQVPDDHRTVGLIAQYMAGFAFKHQNDYDPTKAYAAAVTQATSYRNDPKNSFLFVEEGKYSGKAVSERKTVGGAEVDVKADGTVKKGGKQVVAAQLYKDKVVDGGMAMKDYVNLLMTTLGMSIQGARTYAYAAKSNYEKEKASGNTQSK